VSRKGLAILSLFLLKGIVVGVVLGALALGMHFLSRHSSRWAEFAVISLFYAWCFHISTKMDRIQKLFSAEATSGESSLLPLRPLR
jgi:uncharacterized membrane protein YcaP (DUF421 family)